MIDQIKRGLFRLGRLLQPAGDDATGTARVFPDTNLALHWKRLDEIDWLAITGASQVRIEIAPVFLRELEQQKVTHRSKKLRDRAARMIQWLATFMDRCEPAEIRTHVHLVFVGHEPRIDLASNRLSDRVADDILIASALDAAATSKDQVGIATGDLGLRAKLRSHSRLHAYVPPESDRLPEEADPDLKELNELRTKIARMEAARPALRVSLADEAAFEEIKLRGPLRPIESLASVQERFPLKPTRTGQGMAFAGTPVMGFDSYNERVRRFWADWADYERAYLAFSELLQRSFVGEFVLWNDGGKPATDIDVYVSLPDGLIAIPESDLPKIPRKPTEPTEKASFLQSISDLNHPHFPSFSPPRDGDASIIEDGRRIRFSAERLKHDFHLRLENVVLAFEAGRTPFSFEADYKASCAEAAATSGKLRFVLKS